jgi:hypothetical protein
MDADLDSFVGSLSAGIADMILRQTFIDGYQIPPALAQFLLYGLPCIMAVNVAGVIIFEENDAETLEDKAEKAARFEIHKAAMKQIRADKSAMATEKSDVIYKRVRGRVTGYVDDVYSDGPRSTNSNGHKARSIVYHPRRPAISNNLEVDQVTADPTAPGTRGKGR